MLSQRHNIDANGRPRCRRRPVTRAIRRYTRCMPLRRMSQNEQRVLRDISAVMITATARRVVRCEVGSVMPRITHSDNRYRMRYGSYRVTLFYAMVAFKYAASQYYDVFDDENAAYVRLSALSHAVTVAIRRYMNVG